MIEEFWWMTWFSVGMKGGKKRSIKGGGWGEKMACFFHLIHPHTPSLFTPLGAQSKSFSSPPPPGDKYNRFLMHRSPSLSFIPKTGITVMFH